MNKLLIKQLSIAKSTLVLSALLTSLLLSTFAHAGDYKVPRMPDGSPDMQGVWTNVSLTTLLRNRQYKSNTLSFAEAEKIEQQRALRSARGLEPTDPNAPAPKKGSSVGGYNSFYGDSGERLAIINGEFRTTWLVEPKNGQLPYSAKGQEIYNQAANFTRTNFDNPEARPMAERCIVGFGSTGGPPMINVLYNNNYQIVQNEDTVMIMVEMNHDARIIRLNAEHNPDSMRSWLGDSIGHWDGDTLVVETTQFNPGESVRLNYNQSFYMSPNAKVIERFTRISEKEIFYEFSVDDPEIYSQVWRGEMILNAEPEQIYEYACHEGNYALPGILAGAREEERERREANPGG